MQCCRLFRHKHGRPNYRGFRRHRHAVNNKGITRDKLIMQMSEADYDDVLSVNLKGAYNMIKHTSRQFIKKRYGKIINITSVSGIMGNAGQSNYSSSKAGMIGLTKSVARELAGRGINCNAIAPAS